MFIHDFVLGLCINYLCVCLLVCAVYTFSDGLSSLVGLIARPKLFHQIG